MSCTKLYVWGRAENVKVQRPTDGKSEYSKQLYCIKTLISAVQNLNVIIVSSTPRSGSSFTGELISGTDCSTICILGIQSAQATEQDPDVMIGH